MWSSQPVSSLIYSVPSLVGDWKHPERCPQGIPELRTCTLNTGVSDEKQTQGGSEVLHSFRRMFCADSVMVSVLVSNFRTCSDSHQDLRIAEGSPLKASQGMCYFWISSKRWCSVYFDSEKMSPMPLFSWRWPWRTAWANEESASAELWNMNMHLCIASRLECLNRAIFMNLLSQATILMKMVHLMSSTCTVSKQYRICMQKQNTEVLKWISSWIYTHWQIEHLLFLRRIQRNIKSQISLFLYPCQCCYAVM